MTADLPVKEKIVHMSAIEVQVTISDIQTEWFCQPLRHWLIWRRLGGWHSVADEWNQIGYRDELRVLGFCVRDGAAGGDGTGLQAFPVLGLEATVQ